MRKKNIFIFFTIIISCFSCNYEQLEKLAIVTNVILDEDVTQKENLKNNWSEK